MPEQPDVRLHTDAAVSYLVPCRPNADAARLEAVLRSCGVVARVELPFADDDEPEYVVIAVVPAEEHPEDRPADLLAIRSPRSGFSWESLPAATLAAALAAEFGAVIADRFLWTASGWVGEDDASDAERDRFDQAADLVESRSASRIATAGAFDPLVLRLLARSTPPLCITVDADHVTVWPENDLEPYSLLDGVPAIDGAVTFEVSRYERTLMVADRRTVHLRRWPAGAVVVDPTAGFEPLDGHLVRFEDEGRDIDPNDAVRALRLDDEQASLFRALWRRSDADPTTFRQLSTVLRLPMLAADLVERRVEPPSDASTVQLSSAYGVFRDEMRSGGPTPLPGWIGAWQRFSARHPLLRWLITGLGIALPATLIVLHHIGVRESPVVVLAYVAVVLWTIDALRPRKASD